MSVGQAPIEDEDFNDPLTATGGEVVAIGAASAKVTVVLKPGRYWALASVNCRIKRGVLATVTAANGAATRSTPLLANTYWAFQVRQADVGVRDAVATIVHTSGGTTGELEIFRASR